MSANSFPFSVSLLPDSREQGRNGCCLRDTNFATSSGFLLVERWEKNEVCFLKILFRRKLGLRVGDMKNVFTSLSQDPK
jgi:hypothetical protein